MTQVFFTLPQSFQPGEFLKSPRLATRSDDARWLISTIVRKTANCDTDSWGCVRLHSSILRRIMDLRHSAQIIRALEAGGAIETAPYYAGVKARGFRLAKRYLGDRHVRMPATDPRLIDRIKRERERHKSDDQQTRWRPIHFTLDAHQQHVTITPDADQILATLPDHTRLCQDVLIGSIRRREFPFSVSSTGRVFNAITGLKRELRSALRIHGDTLGSVDIRCAQPALLAMLIGQKFSWKYPPNVPKQRTTYKHGRAGCPVLPSVPVPGSDFPRFAGCSVDGTLYDALALTAGFDRSFVKKRFLVDVLAKRGQYPSDVETVFRDSFPSVFGIVRAVNRDDHGALIRLLQRAESWLVIDNVAPRLATRSSPFMTLHDAVFSPHDSLDDAEGAFRETFREVGFHFGLKREG